MAIGQAHAAPASTQSVETLLSVMKVESMMDLIYASTEQTMRQSMLQTIGDRPISAEEQKILDTLPGKFMVIVKKEFTWERMKSQFVQVYSETFDQVEIDALVAFYRSAPGQAYIHKMPTLMQKSMAIAESQMQTLLPKAMALVEEFMAEIRRAKPAE